MNILHSNPSYLSFNFLTIKRQAIGLVLPRWSNSCPPLDLMWLEEGAIGGRPVKDGRGGLVLRWRRMVALRDGHVVEVGVVGRGAIEGHVVAWGEGNITMLKGVLM